MVTQMLLSGGSIIIRFIFGLIEVFEVPYDLVSILYTIMCYGTWVVGSAFCFYVPVVLRSGSACVCRPGWQSGYMIGCRSFIKCLSDTFEQQIPQSDAGCTANSVMMCCICSKC